MYLEFLKAKNEYIAASHKAAAAGLAAASGGNISVRIAGTDKLLVKPSGITRDMIVGKVRCVFFPFDSIRGIE